MRSAARPVFFLLIATAAWPSPAQQAPPAQTTMPAPPSANQHVAAEDAVPPPDLYTLHVYTNLIQFAVVAVSPGLEPMRNLHRADVNVTLDEGPIFHPTTIRPEGDDALSIAFVIDDSSTLTTLADSFPAALARIVPGGLLPHDHVSFYAVDCAIHSSREDRPALSSESLRSAAIAVLHAPGLHGTRQKPACGSSLRLWDTIAHAASGLAETPGRRVIAVLSMGDDRASIAPVSELSHFLSTKAIAVFAFRDMREFSFRGGTSALTSNRHVSMGDTGEPRPDPLGDLAGGNGGLVFDANSLSLHDRLRTFVHLLRTRYIVEFPRPDDRTAGMHRIDITVPRMLGIVRSTGSSTPVRDPLLEKDPTVLPSAPSPAIVGHHPPKR